MFWQPFHLFGSSAATGVTAAGVLLVGEADGVAFDFTAASARVKDTATPANGFSGAALDLLTYTSPSVKMAMQSDGNIKHGAHNLILQSEDITTDWLNINSTDEANTQTAPDGATTADTLTASSGAGNHRLQALTSDSQITALANTPHAFSVYLKAGTASFATLAMVDGGEEFCSAVFDLTNGTVTATDVGTSLGSVDTDNTTVEDAGNGWFRCILVGNGFDNGATGSARIAIATEATPTLDTAGEEEFTAAGTETIHIWGAQFQRWPAVLTYLPTTTAAVYQLPYEWDTSNNSLGILVEAEFSELALHVNDLTNAVWTKTNCTPTKTATGPDGEANSASILTATAGNATCIQSITSASAERVTYAALKRRTGSGDIDLTQDNGATWTTVAVDGDWTIFPIAAQTLTNPNVGIRIVTSGDAVDVALFNHGVGAFQTSSVIAAGATVTRAEDDISVATSAFNFSATEGTLGVAGRTAKGGGTQVIAQFHDGSEDEIIRIERNASDEIHAIWIDGGVSQADLNLGTVADETDFTCAISWAAGDFKGNIDSGTDATDAAGTLPTVDTFQLGRDSADDHWNGHIAKAVHLPRETTQAERATLQTRLAA